MTSRTLAILAAIALAILVVVLLWLAYEPEGPEGDAGGQPASPTEAQVPATGSDDPTGSGEGVEREDATQPPEEPPVDFVPESEELESEPESVPVRAGEDVGTEPKQEDPAPQQIPGPADDDGEAEEDQGGSQPPATPSEAGIREPEAGVPALGTMSAPDVTDEAVVTESELAVTSAIPDAGEIENGEDTAQQVGGALQCEEPDPAPGCVPTSDVAGEAPEQDNSVALAAPVSSEDGDETQLPDAPAVDDDPDTEDAELALERTPVADAIGEASQQEVSAPLATPVPEEGVGEQDAARQVDGALQCDEAEPAPGCVPLPDAAEEDLAPEDSVAPAAPVPSEDGDETQLPDAPAVDDDPDTEDAELALERAPVADAIGEASQQEVSAPLATPVPEEGVGEQDAARQVDGALQCDEAEPAPGCVPLPDAAEEDLAPEDSVAPAAPVPSEDGDEAQLRDVPAAGDVPDTDDAEPALGRSPVADAIDEAPEQEISATPATPVPEEGVGEEDAAQQVDGALQCDEAEPAPGCVPLPDAAEEDLAPEDSVAPAVPVLSEDGDEAQLRDVPAADDVPDTVDAEPALERTPVADAIGEASQPEVSAAPATPVPEEGVGEEDAAQQVDGALQCDEAEPAPGCVPLRDAAEEDLAPEDSVAPAAPVPSEDGDEAQLRDVPAADDAPDTVDAEPVPERTTVPGATGEAPEQESSATSRTPEIEERVEEEDAAQQAGGALQCDEAEPAPGCVPVSDAADEEPVQEDSLAPTAPDPAEDDDRLQPPDALSVDDVPNFEDGEPAPGHMPVPDEVDEATEPKQEDPVLLLIPPPVSGAGNEEEVRGVPQLPVAPSVAEIPELEAPASALQTAPFREGEDTEPGVLATPVVTVPGVSVDRRETGQPPQARAADGDLESGEKEREFAHVPLPDVVDGIGPKQENPARLLLPRLAAGDVNVGLVRDAPRAVVPVTEGSASAKALETGPDPIPFEGVGIPENEEVAILRNPEQVDASEIGGTSRLQLPLPSAYTPEPVPSAPALRVPGQGRDGEASEPGQQPPLTAIAVPERKSSRLVPETTGAGREPVSVGLDNRLGEVELPAEPDQPGVPPAGVDAQQTEPLGRRALGVLADWLSELLAAGTPGRGGPVVDDAPAESGSQVISTQPDTFVVADAGRELRQEPGVGAGDLVASGSTGVSGDRLASPGAETLDQSIAATAVQELVVPGSGAGESADVLPGAVVEPEPPSFDVVRSDAQGGTVVAGRAPGRSRVEILVNGEVVADVRASDRGEWVTILDGTALPGEAVLTLRATTPDGRTLHGAARVALLRPDTSGSAVVVELTEDGAAQRLPTATLDDSEITIESLSYSEQDDVEISGRAIALAPVKVSVGETGTERLGDAAELVTVRAGEDGRWTAVLPGRLLEAGKVYRIRAVATLSDGSVVEASTPFKRNRVRFAFQEGAVVVQPGNNLWIIARHVYGRGIRYHWIYQANSDQIDDPDLIYPGQVFIVPEEGPEMP